MFKGIEIQNNTYFPYWVKIFGFKKTKKYGGFATRVIYKGKLKPNEKIVVNCKRTREISILWKNVKDKKELIGRVKRIKANQCKAEFKDTASKYIGNNHVIILVQDKKNAIVTVELLDVSENYEDLD